MENINLETALETENPKTSRKLASIQRIDTLSPIPNADSIEVAQVQGWECVVKKGEFKVGDLGCYFEIDSQLPDKPEFQFLASKKFRIRTIKLRGQISQGLMLPLSTLSTDLSQYQEHDNVTDVIGVKKYEPRQFKGSVSAFLGRAAGYFPTFIRKTDEERIQNCKHILTKCAGMPFYYAEKLDGSSYTAYVKDDHFSICSRNLELKRGEFQDGIFWSTADSLQLETKLRSLGRNIALQGEIVGPGTQGNKYGLETHTVYFFNGWNIDQQRHMDYDELRNILTTLDLQMVPIIGENIVLDHDVKQLVQLATEGESALAPVLREGHVWRPMKELWLDRFGRVSFKVINPEFLLKHKL